jgi:hypothetical protein
MARAKRDLERTTVFLPPANVRELRTLAEKKGESVASLIRGAVEEYLQQHRRPAGRRSMPQ